METTEECAWPRRTRRGQVPLQAAADIMVDGPQGVIELLDLLAGG